jgi:Bifunctional DNA primase/polymerase, N-terminal
MLHKWFSLKSLQLQLLSPAVHHALVNLKDREMPRLSYPSSDHRAAMAAKHTLNGGAKLTLVSSASISPEAFEQRIDPPPHPVMDAALEYAGRGWHIFPVPMPEKKSCKSAKHSNGSKWGQTTDPDEIRNDFRRWPNAGVGIATGHQSGFFVVEADTAEGHAINGIQSLVDLRVKHGELPPTRMAVSPSGSIHYYFNHPGLDIKIKNSASEIAAGVDARGDGGMVVAPPSVKPGKGQYRWVNDLPVADAPPWLIEKVVERPKAKASGNGISAKNSRGKPYSDQQLKNLLEDSRVDGKRQNSMMMAIAIMVGQGLTDFQIMMEIGPYLDKPGFNEEKIRQLLQSARDKYEKPDPGGCDSRDG